MNKKHDTQAVLTYPQSFGSSMKKSVKRMVEWVAYYFTSREIWYSLPENTMKLEDIKFPKRKKDSSILFPHEKKRNAGVGIIKWCCCPKEVEGKKLQ